MSAACIACIGWGSLLWDPRSLPIAHPFLGDGPRLPIEFARVARDGRVTLVIDSDAETLPIGTYWTRLEVPDLDAAIESLGRRERIKPARFGEWIGAEGRDGASRGEALPETRSTMRAFLADQGLDGVVWTALPSRTPKGEFARPSLDSLVAHLQTLAGEALARAEEYIRRAPEAVVTRNRTRFEEALGWTRSTLPPNPGTPGQGD